MLLGSRTPHHGDPACGHSSGAVKKLSAEKTSSQCVSCLENASRSTAHAHRVTGFVEGHHKPLRENEILMLTAK